MPEGIPFSRYAGGLAADGELVWRDELVSSTLNRIVFTACLLLTRSCAKPVAHAPTNVPPQHTGPTLVVLEEGEDDHGFYFFSLHKGDYRYYGFTEKDDQGRYHYVRRQSYDIKYDTDSGLSNVYVCVCEKGVQSGLYDLDYRPHQHPELLRVDYDSWLDKWGHVHTLAVLNMQRDFNVMLGNLGIARNSLPSDVSPVPITGLVDRQTLLIPYMKLRLRWGNAWDWRNDMADKLYHTRDYPEEQSAQDDLEQWFNVLQEGRASLNAYKAALERVRFQRFWAPVPLHDDWHEVIGLTGREIGYPDSVTVIQPPQEELSLDDYLSARDSLSSLNEKSVALVQKAEAMGQALFGSPK